MTLRLYTLRFNAIKLASFPRQQEFITD